MIACEGARELAQAYLEDELDAADRGRLERHLAACPTCRHTMAGYRQLFAALGEPALPPVPPGFAEAVAARAGARARRRRAWQALALAAAIFVASSVGALLAWGGLPGDVTAVADAAPSLDAWRGVWDSAVQSVESVAAAGSGLGGELPGGAWALALLAVGFGAQWFLAYRWRPLASPDTRKQARVMP